jgi:hypothetical protein
VKRLECPDHTCPLNAFGVEGAAISINVWALYKNMKPAIRTKDIDTFPGALKAFLFSKCMEHGKLVHELLPGDLCVCAEIPF